MEVKSHETLTYRLNIGKPSTKSLKQPMEKQKLASQGSQARQANFIQYSGCFHQS
jgi:hypothetical protein